MKKVNTVKWKNLSRRFDGFLPIPMDFGIYPT